jgi:hypothetical protein
MIGQLIRRHAARLRFPTLFFVTATLFVIDLVVPDVIPLIDEIMLALTTLLLAALKKRKPQVP